MGERKKLVNWQDSMELSAAHFRQQEDYFINEIRESLAVRMTSYNYGLLPVVGEQDKDEGIHISQHVTEHVDVRVEYCNAITPSGLRLYYDSSQTGQALEKTFTPPKDKEQTIQQWDVIIAADPFDRQVSGLLDPAENPPRYPDAEPTCRIYVMPAGKSGSKELGAHYLTIGRIRISGNRYVVDADYIPPCTTMKSHPALTEYYEHFKEALSNLEKTSVQIISKVRNQSNRSVLPGNIAQVCEDLLAYIAADFYGFSNKGSFYAPIDVVGYMAGVAHRLYVSLQRLSGVNRDELLRYFYEWSNVSPGSFTQSLSETLEITYDHNQIRSVMVKINLFLDTLLSLWQRISRLEYIGQHKENIIVSEQSSAEVTKASRGWSVEN